MCQPHHRPHHLITSPAPNPLVLLQVWVQGKGPRSAAFIDPGHDATWETKSPRVDHHRLLPSGGKKIYKSTWKSIMFTSCLS